MRIFFALVAFCCTLFGAANLTISSAALSVDGTTLSLTMSQSGLLPVSGISGCFTMHGGNKPSLSVSSATSGGSIVTAVLSDPYNGNDVPTIDIATAAGGCNLTGSSGANTPQGQTGVSIANNSEWYSARALPNARYDGIPSLTVVPGDGVNTNVVGWDSALGSISVHANGSEVQLWALQYGNGFCLFQDGLNVGRFKATGATTWIRMSLAAGLSGTHLYRIMGCAGASSFQGVLISQVRFVSGAPVAPTPPVTLPTIMACGDSIVGSGSAPDDSSTVDWGLLTTAGWAAQIEPESGVKVVPTLMNNCGTKMVPFGGTTPAIGVLEGGANDQFGSGYLTTLQND